LICYYGCRSSDSAVWEDTGKSSDLGSEPKELKIPHFWANSYNSSNNWSSIIHFSVAPSLGTSLEMRQGQLEAASKPRKHFIRFWFKGAYVHISRDRDAVRFGLSISCPYEAPRILGVDCSFTAKVAGSDLNLISQLSLSLCRTWGSLSGDNEEFYVLRSKTIFSLLLCLEKDFLTLLVAIRVI
jgi:hypothetical protein